MKPSIEWILGGVGSIAMAALANFITRAIAADALTAPEKTVFEKMEEARLYTWVGNGCTLLLAVGGLAAIVFGVVQVVRERRWRKQQQLQQKTGAKMRGTE